MKKWKCCLAAVLFLFSLMALAVQAAEIYDYSPVPKSQPVVIDGYSEELVWEESLFLKMDMGNKIGSQSKYAVLRILCDTSHLYLQVFVADDDRADYYGTPDGALIELVEGGQQRLFHAAYDGRNISPALPQQSGGFVYAADNNDCYYLMECQIPFLKEWKTDGTFTLKVTVIDNIVSGGRIQSFRTEKELHLNLFLKAQPVQPPTTAPATTQAAEAPRTTVPKPNAEKTTAPAKNNQSGSKAPTTSFPAPTYPSTFGTSREMQTLAEATASVGQGGEEIVHTQMEFFQADDGRQVLQTIPTTPKSTEATQAFGTLAAGLLLFFGVFTLLRLRKGKKL